MCKGLSIGRSHGDIRGHCYTPKCFLCLPNFGVPRKLCFKHKIKTKILPPKCLFFSSPNFKTWLRSCWRTAIPSVVKSKKICVEFSFYKNNVDLMYRTGLTNRVSRLKPRISRSKGGSSKLCLLVQNQFDKYSSTVHVLTIHEIQFHSRNQIAQW